MTSPLPPQTPAINEIEHAIFNFVITLVQHRQKIQPQSQARLAVAQYLNSLASGLEQLSDMNSSDNEKFKQILNTDN